MNIENFIKGLPKAELHVHIEGTFEPELMLEIARRNNIEIKYKSAGELRKAYNFNNLKEFLDLYYLGTAVLINERDFYDMTWAYLAKAHSQNILHSEIFFDPQAHTDRGVEFKIAIGGIHNALIDAKEKLGISTKLIMDFCRSSDAQSAMKALDESLAYKECIVGMGLDGAEIGNPPSKFKEVFDRARQLGFLVVAHAGEEGPVEYVWEALKLLKVSRIDHGNHSLDDEKLVADLAKRKIPLTVCPLSNLKLRIVGDLKHHPLKKMMQKGLLVTINSDDPAFFGGYINENYLALSNALGLTKEELCRIAKNSFQASFIGKKEKNEMIRKLDVFRNSNAG